MAAPPTTERSTPAGIPLDDGFSTLFAFAADADISIWEKEVTPPTISGGELIDITTMHNTTWITKVPQQLLTLGESSFLAAYDPDCYNQLVAIVNLNRGITIHFPDGSTLDFWGVLREVGPQRIARNNQPEIEVTVEATNWDYANRVEAAPVLTSVAGT